MKKRQYTSYHRGLRISAFVFALVLVFESGLLTDTTKSLSVNTHNYLANVVGMSASVQPTELNKFTAELSQWERDLEEREAALSAREIEVGITEGTGEVDNQTATYVLASILFILLVLILLNYTLDYLRARERQELRTV